MTTYLLDCWRRVEVSDNNIHKVFKNRIKGKLILTDKMKYYKKIYKPVSVLTGKSDPMMENTTIN